MQQIVQIQNQNLTVKEYKGKRVVTLKDIDMVHERPEGTAGRNFRENKGRFIENGDFYFVKPSDIQTDEIRRSEINNSGTYLITESGYLMLVKSFTDDLAWKVQRELVNSYFRVRYKTVVNPDPYIFLEAAKIMAMLPDTQQYVINCLRHVVSDIDMATMQGQVSKVKESTPKKERYIKEGVDIDKNKLMLEIGNQGISLDAIAKKANVSVVSVTNWISGKHKPVLQNRTNLCHALGKDDDFLTPRRTRNVKN